jgi:diacylglycerol kinase (ATP)
VGIHWKIVLHIIVNNDNNKKVKKIYTFMLLTCIMHDCRYVKLLTITHPTIEVELYQLAAETAANLEKVHPGGKIIEGVNLPVIQT